MENIGFPGLVIMIVVAFIVFGPQRLPELARAAGEAVRAFQEAVRGQENDQNKR